METIATWLYNNIVMIYKLLKEFLFSNDKNLIEKVIEAYTQLLKIKH